MTEYGISLNPHLHTGVICSTLVVYHVESEESCETITCQVENG
jgi:hypothetical protein